MDWKKERDLLIAQTLAFVQSVTGNKPDLEQTPAEQQASLEQQTSAEPAVLEQLSLAKTSPVPTPDVERAAVPVAPAVRAAPILAAASETKTALPSTDAPKPADDISRSI